MGMMCRTILRIMCGAIGPAAARDGPPPAARQLAAAIGRTFRSFDSDGNGTLDLGELRAAFASMVPPPRRPQPAGRARLGSRLLFVSRRCSSRLCSSRLCSSRLSASLQLSALGSFSSRDRSLPAALVSAPVFRPASLQFARGSALPPRSTPPVSTPS